MYIRGFIRISTFVGVSNKRVMHEYKCDHCGDIYSINKSAVKRAKSFHLCTDCEDLMIMDMVKR